MLAAVTAGTGHPAVAVLLGLGAAALAALVVAMAWNVHVRQIRLAGQLARRQFVVTGDAAAADAGDELQVVLEGADRAAAQPAAPPVAIEGPETLVTGEQARYRARTTGNCKVVSWAVGGGSVSQAPDPSHADELLLTADQPGALMIFVRAREGMMERRATKSVTAVPEVAEPAPPFTLRLFLHGWGLITVAVLVVGFAGALAALGTLAPADFIALTVPLAALVAVVAVVRGGDDTPRAPGNSTATHHPGALKAYTGIPPGSGNANGHHPADAEHR
jgi:hypothetical protein